MVDFSTKDTTGTILISHHSEICSHTLAVQYCTNASSAETTMEDEITGKFVTIGQGITQRFFDFKALE